MKKAIQRIFILVIVSAIVTFGVFVSINRPKFVHADVISGVALGTGALAVLLASYFSVAGIQVTQNGGGTSVAQDFFTDTAERFRQADLENQEKYDLYFNENGEYIGSERDLQFVLSDQAYGYYNMGKGLNSLFEDIKNWFVSENSLSVGTTTSLYSSESYNFPFGTSYPYIDFTNGSILNHETVKSLVPIAVGTYYYSAIDANDIMVSITYDRPIGAFPDTTHIIEGDYSFNGNTQHFRTNSKFQDGLYIGFNVTQYFGTYTMRFGVLSASNDGSYPTGGGLEILTVNSSDISSIGIEGALTDGYQDFQDALNQDLTNEQDNENAVVQVGVGELTGALTGQQVVDALLDQIATNTLDTTYEGVYENQQEATEDKEGEKEFVPELPEGWVVVNGLEDFFPFCIPYDFYSLVSFFDAPPEAPVFEFDIELGGVLGTHHVELDFSTFDTVARIFRITVVIGFIVFLVLATRSRFIRG